jgi:hypothetical protein
MSVTVRPYVTGGGEVDIRVELPDGTLIRERKKAPSMSKSAAQRWAEARERVLLVHGKPRPAKKQEVEQKIPTLQEFAPPTAWVRRGGCSASRACSRSGA